MTKWGVVLCLLVVPTWCSCRDRHECNDHGNCVNNKCVCDPGWTGPHCRHSLCPLQCQHGGVPNSPTKNCTHCLGCWPGWDGKTCSSWNDTSASLPDMQAKLEGFRLASWRARQTLLNQTEPPIPGTFGLGIDGSTSQYKQLPVFQLDFSNPNLTWTSLATNKTYRIPGGSTFKLLDGTTRPTQTSAQFRNIGEYNTYISKLVQDSQGNTGFNADLGSAYTTSFTDGCTAYSVTERQFGIYELIMGNNRTLDRYAAAAVDYLPPKYNTTKERALWDKFLENWGTDVASRIVVGGLIVSQQRMLSSGITLGGFNWNEESQVDLACQLGDNTSCHSLSSLYLGSRVQDDIALYGGNPQFLPTEWKQWIPTIESNPYQITYAYQSTLELIPDLEKRSAFRLAVETYETNRRNQATSIINTNAKPHVCPGTLQIVTGHVSHTVFVECPIGHRVLSCAERNPQGDEKFRSYIPTTRNSRDGCNNYDYYGDTGVAVCGALADPSALLPDPLPLYQVVSTHVPEAGSVTCPPGLVVVGCGYVPSSGHSESYPWMYPSSESQCFCYDHYGSTCYAVCTRKPSGYEIITAGPVQGWATAKCSKGKSVLGCGFKSWRPTGDEPFKQFYPNTAGSCTCYDDQSGVTCYAICAVVA